MWSHKNIFWFAVSVKSINKKQTNYRHCVQNRSWYKLFFVLRKVVLLVMTWLRHCTVVRLPSGRKNNLQHHSSSCLFLELFSSLEGNWNIRCSFVFETATSHRPFLTLSAFHLRTVMFTVLLAWRQPLFSSAHSTAFLFLEFSIDGCLHFHWLPSYLSYQPR